jgi:biotin carboxyl carrier protein
VKYETRIGDRGYEVEITPGEGGPRVLLDSREISVDFSEISPHALYSVIIDGRSYELWLRREGADYHVFAEGRSLCVTVRDERRRRVESLQAAMPQAKTGFTLRAPMPAVVTAVLVEPGQQVKRGDILCRLEAMKMENEMASEADGTVKEVKVSAGEGVEKDRVLVVVE